MKLVLLTTDPGRVDWLQSAALEYTKKISHLVPFEIILVKISTQGRADRESKKREDSEALLKRIQEKDFVIVCDERGQSLDSIRFSQKLVRSFESGRPRVVIVIGGPYGMSSELTARADWTWKLSDLIYNHWIAKVVVLEQLFRALAIWKNLPYHND